MAHHYLATIFTPQVQASQQRAYGRAQVVARSSGLDVLGPEEGNFIAAADSFYLGSVNSDGWPYIQHRGGPRGFLHLLDANTLSFADLTGNRQLVSTGNVAANDRVALFIMDYPGRRRLKLIGHATISPSSSEPELAARLTPPGLAPRLVERIWRIRVVGFDWNCPKYITPRYTRADIAELVTPLRTRIAELEAALASANRASSEQTSS